MNDDRRFPGAGARVLADLDLAGVVSKWIGETEKNLAAVFDAAERTQSVLFLDEAGALFGRRTDASDSHDRYANLETAHLLQRVEGFEGVVVLATSVRPVDPPEWLTVVEAEGDDDSVGRVGLEPTTDG